VACVLAGARTAAEVRENVDMMTTDIPESFWDALTEELDA
jgi:aryl-alcohol dehydrogenase-like predicted oxidoreductase